MLADPRIEGSIRLRDGRRLGYAEFGPVSGRPLLWFHGTPGARRQIAPEARGLAEEREVRIVSVERPGIGESTTHAYEALVEFAGDIEQLCDALEVERYAVAGLSGGGPYALACAHEMPERVTMAAILGGVAPSVGPDAAEGGMNPLMKLAAPLMSVSATPVSGALRGLIRVLEPYADEAIELFARLMPPHDQEVLLEPLTRRMFQEDLLMGSRRNMRALVLDAALFGRDWGFALEGVQVPVFLRYGDSDNIVPAEHGEHLSRKLPDAELRIYPGEGHLGGLGASAEIFDAVLARWGRDEQDER